MIPEMMYRTLRLSRLPLSRRLRITRAQLTLLTVQEEWSALIGMCALLSVWTYNGLSEKDYVPRKIIIICCTNVVHKVVDLKAV